MRYRELIKKIQYNSGFSDSESKNAIDNLTTVIAERLAEAQRQDFATQLPRELQRIALTVEPISNNKTRNIIEEFMELENIDEVLAKKQVLSAWEALKSFISSGEIEDIKSQMPAKTAKILN